MKAKYLIQLQTNNANMGATGWFTVSGAMTKRAALETLADFEAAQGDSDNRALRVVSYDQFTSEVRAANHAAMRGLNHA